MTENVTRVQFDLPAAKVAELNQLMDEAGIGSRRELFNYALSLLQWSVRQREEGRVIAAINESGNSYRELSMPILDNIRPRRASAARD